MLLDNSMALIAVIAVFAVSIFSFITLILARRKERSAVSQPVFLSLLLLLAGILGAIALNSTFVLVIAVLLQNALLIPFWMSLKNQKAPEPQQAPVEEPAAAAPVQDESLPEISEKQLAFFDVNKKFVLQASDAFVDEASYNRMLESVIYSMMSETGATGGVILIIDDFDDVIAVKSFAGEFPPPFKLPDDVPHKVVRVDTHFRFAQFGLDENIFGKVARSGKPELITDPLSDDRIYQNEDEEFLKCGSYIFLPMVVNEKAIGIIALARTANKDAFTETDFQKAQILCDFACASVKNVYSFQEFRDHTDLVRESEIATKLQETMNPKVLPVVPGIQLGSFQDKTDGVCGDYYDVLPSRQDRISFIMADVAGKGMNSVVIMIMLRAIMRLITNTKQTAATIIQWANRGIAVEDNIDHFASLSLLNYDGVNHKVEYATAGSSPILYYSAETGKTEQLYTSSEPIGIEKQSTYADNTIDVHSGDILVLFSDGIAEAVNKSGAQYTIDRLITAVTDNKDAGSKEIASLVKADIKDFTGSARQHDDQTLLVIKIQ